jgi:hypothetical protein
MTHRAPDIAAARLQWERDSILSPREVIKRRRSIVEPFCRHEGVLAWLEWSSLCTIVKLEAINPHKGAGTAFLKYLTTLADTHQITLFGNPVVYSTNLIEEAFLPQQQLELWYQKHGFTITRSERGIVELRYEPS